MDRKRKVAGTQVCVGNIDYADTHTLSAQLCEGDKVSVEKSDKLR